nr:ATP-binding protein [uncultured Tyzzerella sp.]
MGYEITYCENCGEQNTMVINLLGVDRLVPCLCNCRKAKIEQEKLEEHQKEIERRMSTLIAQGIMDKEFLQNTFEKDNGSNMKVFNVCKKYVENWEKMKSENIGILFYGDVGRGKTFYASCIANELFKNGVSVCITSFPKIINKLMNFTEQSKLLVEKVKSQSLLVIDDFGVERETEFVLEQMFQIIDDRLRSGLPTIITTNIELKELKEPKTLAQRRIYDRILEMCSIQILVDNKNNRQEKANRKTQLARQLLLG